MAHDLTSKFYSCLNLPVYQKLAELARIIDQSSPNKELQALFPQLISHIFASSLTNGWGLRNSYESQRYDYDHLLQFLEPQGPLLRLCYKLLSDPQLKYELPINLLPMDLQVSLEMGRCPQFYSDMLATDPQTMNVSALMLNPFDYYMFNFALHLVNNGQNKSTWENKNSVYFALACDYLLHFLPVDPNIPVLPHIPNYTGKMTMAAPLQAANRPYSPSLLLMSDLSGAIVNNQHPQTQSRNEVWRSETVLQVLIDIWMSVDQFNNMNIDMFQSVTSQCLSPERVRTVRVLVKHLHSFSAKHLSDPAIRSSALRKYARQLLCTRGYHYIKHLVTTWPLDASFRLVLELWLSLIQPWRYVNNCISREIISNNNQEEVAPNTLDATYIQFIAENFPSYTCIFQLVLPRFMRLDLTSPKNAIMLFRLGKVFSQPHLIPILKNLEHAITYSGAATHHSPDNSFNSSGYDHNYHTFLYNGVPLNKWMAIAKQAISELNLSPNFEYEPIWCDAVQLLATEFIKKNH